MNRGYTFPLEKDLGESASYKHFYPVGQEQTWGNVGEESER
jgi:hypothetical protein